MDPKDIQHEARSELRDAETAEWIPLTIRSIVHDHEVSSRCSQHPQQPVHVYRRMRQPDPPTFWATTGWTRYK